jgi:hypothetical protein
MRKKFETTCLVCKLRQRPLTSRHSIFAPKINLKLAKGDVTRIISSEYKTYAATTQCLFHREFEVICRSIEIVISFVLFHKEENVEMAATLLCVFITMLLTVSFSYPLAASTAVAVTEIFVRLTASHAIVPQYKR